MTFAIEDFDVSHANFRMIEMRCDSWQLTLG